MGICGGKPENPEQEQKNKEINKQLNEDKRKYQREYKLLLLGAGESGKSTFAKQMKILHLQGFSNEEREVYKSIIFDNVLANTLSLVKGAQLLNIPISDEEAAETMLEHDGYSPEDIYKLAPIVKRIWVDPGIKRALEKSSNFQLLDNCHYYMNMLDKMLDDKYVPNDEDILHSRSKTTGIIETEFFVDKMKFKMTDVGGQRSERKKWMHCFQEVAAVIFCDAISSYDQKLEEDNITNRMLESLRLFGQICNNKWFTDTSIILFLNKKDIFAEKIKTIPITAAFPEYSGAGTFEATSEFIKQKFLAQNENKKKSVYPHITCATDTSNIKHVFEAVKDIVLQESSTLLY